MAKLSVIIPVYNVENYLKECLDSIAKNKSVFFHVYISINKSKIQEKDIITIDMGCKINGYCSDMTRTIFVGSVSDEVRKKGYDHSPEK